MPTKVQSYAQMADVQKAPLAGRFSKPALWNLPHGSRVRTGCLAALIVQGGIAVAHADA